MRNAILLILILLCSCSTQYHHFEYVTLVLDDGSKVTYKNCTGGVQRSNGGDYWLIIDDNNTTHIHYLSEVKSFNWEYSLEEYE